MSESNASSTSISGRKDLQLICDLIQSESRVLDIGCGEGDLLDLLKLEKNIDGRGVEISQVGVNACVTRGLSVVQGDADRDLKHFPDNGFDYAILSQTLQATQRPDSVLKELARIGKKLIVSFPNFANWRVRFYCALQNNNNKEIWVVGFRTCTVTHTTGLHLMIVTVTRAHV